MANTTVRHSSNREAGVALITTLIIVGLVAALSIGLAVAHDRTLLKAESRFHGNQALEYLLGAEELARFVLDEDFKDDQENNEEVDSLDESWNQQQQFPLDEGSLLGQISDAQAKFDINRLAEQVATENSDRTSPQSYTADQRRFIRLLQILDEEEPLSLPEAQAILAPIIDWLDEDDTPFGFEGAESLEYQRQEPPIRPTNGPIKSISELRLVKSITPELFDLLEPYITALPAGSSGLNVNTAGTTLLRTLNIEEDFRPLSVSDAEQIQLDRAGVGYIEFSDFSDGAVPTTLRPQGEIPPDGLTFSTEYFTLLAVVEVGRQRRSQTSLLFRNGDDTVVIQRSDFGL